MGIGRSDSIVNILNYHLRALGMDPMVLCGSQFPDDADGDYSYSVLSRIMVRILNHSQETCGRTTFTNSYSSDVR